MEANRSAPAAPAGRPPPDPVRGRAPEAHEAAPFEAAPFEAPPFEPDPELEPEFDREADGDPDPRPWALPVLALLWLGLAAPSAPPALAGIGPAASVHAAVRALDAGPVDPLRDSPRRLRALPGIGARRALAVAEERWRRGGDFAPEAWDALDGVGPGTVGGVRAALRVPGPGFGAAGAWRILDPHAHAARGPP